MTWSLLNINFLCYVLCDAFSGLRSNSVITAMALNKQGFIYLSVYLERFKESWFQALAFPQSESDYLIDLSSSLSHRRPSLSQRMLNSYFQCNFQHSVTDFLSKSSNVNTTIVMCASLRQRANARNVGTSLLP